MITPSDTPRTDANQEHVANTYNDWVCRTDEANPPALYVVPADFAKQLERELAAANARIAKLESIGSGLLDYAETENDKDPCVMEWLELVGRKAT